MDPIQWAYILFTASMMVVLLYILVTLSRNVEFRRIGIIYAFLLGMAPDYLYFISKKPEYLGFTSLLPILLVVALGIRGGPKVGVRVHALLFTLLIVLEEYLMGLAYVSVFQGGPLDLASGVNNPVFGLMMILDAAAIYAIKRGLIPLLFGVSMGLSPAIFANMGLEAQLYSALISSALMTAFIALIYKNLARTDDAPKGEFIHNISMSLTSLLMMIGLGYASLTGYYGIMGLVMLAGMIPYLYLSLVKIEGVIRWRVKPYLPTIFTSILVAAEIVMAFGVNQLGLMVSGSSSVMRDMGDHEHIMAGSMNILTLFFYLDPWSEFQGALAEGSLGFLSPIHAFVVLFMHIVMTPIYVLMMGSEMLFLVLDRGIELLHKGFRGLFYWSLATGAGTFLFALYLAYYTPVYIYGMSGHGIVEYFPLSVALSLTALGIGVFLLGRRLECTVVCMAGHMSLNSYYARFRAKQYRLVRLNADSGLGKVLTNAVTVVSALAFPTVLAAYFMGLPGPGDFTWLDVYGMGIVNVIWFMFYFLSPIMGSYSCSRYGYCGFGTLMGILGNKLGFFKLRVKDMSTCMNCPTRDCEKACPPGIPLWVDFISKGASRNIRCVGYGECVAACPYGNLVMEDAIQRIRVRIRGPL